MSEEFDELKKFLTTAPIVRAPNRKLPFEVMCDASDLAMGAVLGQREDGRPYVIYYASKTLNEAQRNYTTTEKELLVVVFTLDKFRAYLVGSNIVVFTDHSALKYLLTKQDAKARLIRWILLLREFNLQIRDKKGVENVVADHLSRLVIAHDSHGLPINDDFPKESLMSIKVAPWYSHVANYLVTGEVPSEWSARDKKHFFTKIHAYYWEEPFLFKYCADQIIRKCVPEQEQSGILSHCHDNACGGHFASQKTAMKVIQSGFGGPLFSRMPTSMCKGCDRCQRLGKLTRRTMMPLNPILIVDVFDVWGIDFMGPFPIVPFPVEIEYKAWWAIKKLNMDLTRAGKVEIQVDGSFIIREMYPNGVVEIFNPKGNQTFKVNGHRLKTFLEPYNTDKEEINLLEPQQL
ncbi:Retrovirus-related Pol polyprotein from transposon opus [Vitis vinifera]|uniref:Retrovirus-related Pol polyprotein from transposon opus n=1 Tax=Vitis vinifera TaxID=29760 RepID=A0A438IS02_VITVI|nr:Retrovirus-related Pol polyprotein from transposon opus [Vitis vinifera]